MSDQPTTEPRNVIVIGSGPAGYTAALYTARAALQPLVFEGSVTAGGALMNTTEVENFPGFRDGIMGPALMDEMRAQAERFGAELVPDDVVEVDLTGDAQGRQDRDRHLHRPLGDPRDRLRLPQARACPARRSSPAAASRGARPATASSSASRHIAVVGGGDSAIEEATFLTRFGSKVYLIHRRDELRASKIMQERAFADPKLEIVWNAEVAEINGDDRLESVTLRDTVTGETRDLRGHRPVHRDRPRPALGAARRPGRPRRRRLRPGPAADDARPTCPASSPAATWSTTTTARPSPPPAPAAPRRSTPSATSPRSTTRPPAPATPSDDRRGPAEAVQTAGPDARTGASSGRTRLDAVRDGNNCRPRGVH